MNDIGKMKRLDGRKPNQLRSVTMRPDFVIYPEGSVLIGVGKTCVLCNVTVEDGVPRWMERQRVPGGWITAEYALLPRSTQSRTGRETRGLRGRTQEIRRLIGRSLRASVNLELLGERTCIVDCDVIQADGGTRTAAITGGYVALAIALSDLVAQGLVSPDLFHSPVAAVSVGIVEGQILLDLCYQEDVAADVDVNIVMNAKGEFIEVQGTAERGPFSRKELSDMLDLADGGIKKLLAYQRELIPEK